jgi:hypothetical protein
VDAMNATAAFVKNFLLDVVLLTSLDCSVTPLLSSFLAFLMNSLLVQSWGRALFNDVDENARTCCLKHDSRRAEHTKPREGIISYLLSKE